MKAPLVYSTLACVVHGYDYTRYTAKNAFDGHGGINIDSDSSAPAGLSVEACEARCDADVECDCVAFQISNGKCYKRASCSPSEFVASESCDTYQKNRPPAPTPPPGPMASAPNYAAISIVDRMTGSVAPSIGQAKKHRQNPLFRQDRAWEPRIDNGYPNIVAPKKHGDSFDVWYGTCSPAGCNRQLLLFANSTDGLVWTKPNLGLFDLDRAELKLEGYGTANNIMLEGGGIGVFRDDHEADPSKRYKALGPGCWGGGADPASKANCNWWDFLSEESGVGLRTRRFTGQQAVSADGLIWSEGTNISWPPPQKWDTHTNAFWDERSSRYIVTTRSIPALSGGVRRVTSIDVSPSASWGFDTHYSALITNEGGQGEEPYAQVTWPWLNTYLGISMVFDAGSADEKVHCRLMWSNSPHSTEWHWVEGGVDGPDFIPLGDSKAFDSHICFAAASPFSWSGEERVYYMGGDGPHGGDRRSSFGLATLRQHGYASIRGTGKLFTVKVPVTGPVLTVTVDFAAGGSLRIGALGAGSGLGLGSCEAVTANGTEAQVRFSGGADFGHLVGKELAFEVELAEASLYTIGFASAASEQAAIVL